MQGNADSSRSNGKGDLILGFSFSTSYAGSQANDLLALNLSKAKGALNRLKLERKCVFFASIEKIFSDLLGEDCCMNDFNLLSVIRWNVRPLTPRIPCFPKPWYRPRLILMTRPVLHRTYEHRNA